MQSFTLLPLIAALALGKEPFSTPQTPDQKFILEQYGLHDATTRQQKAAALLPAAERSLERSILIDDDDAFQKAVRMGADESNLHSVLYTAIRNNTIPDYNLFTKQVTRSALVNAHKQESKTYTIIPAIQAEGLSAALTKQDYVQILFENAPADYLQQNAAGKLFCRLPLRDQRGTISFAKCTTHITTVKDLLTAVSEFKQSSQCIFGRKVHIAVPTINAQEPLTEDTSTDFQLNVEGRQVIGNNKPFIGLALTRPCHIVDFAIPPTSESLCWIEDNLSNTTFVAHLSQSNYSKEQYPAAFEKIQGSLENYPD